MRSGRKKIFLNTEQEAYLRANYKTIPSYLIGRSVGVSTNLIKVSMVRLGLEVPKKEEMVIDFVNGTWNDLIHRELFNY